MHTVTQAAKQIGASTATVRRICRENDIGTELTPRMRLLSDEDIERVRQLFRGKAGNPNFVPGNYFGLPPKKTSKNRKK